jgi:ferredoxin-NADP reductase
METPGVNSVTTPTSKKRPLPTDWRVGTVTHIRNEAPGLRSYTFAFDTPVRHEPGQHYEIRLTAPDGYQAARLYSAAMPANGSGNHLQLTIALMPYGEISPYIFNHVHTGSQLEIRGPLGKYFTWPEDDRHPILLIGGGTGVVPLRAIRLAHQQCCSEAPIKLLYSVKAYHDMTYKYELFPTHGECPDDVIMTFTERAPEGWQGYARRIDAAMIRDILAGYTTAPHAYVCGPTPMVEAVADLLVAAGLDPATIKTERFGPTN